ncbi:MAG: hypothetical protein VB835_16360 [Pirellulales bacterium]
MIHQVVTSGNLAEHTSNSIARFVYFHLHAVYRDSFGKQLQGADYEDNRAGA